MVNKIKKGYNKQKNNVKSITKKSKSQKKKIDKISIKKVNRKLKLKINRKKQKILKRNIKIITKKIKIKKSNKQKQLAGLKLRNKVLKINKKIKIKHSENINKRDISEVQKKINSLGNKDFNKYLMNLEVASAASQEQHKRGRKKKENRNIPKPVEVEEVLNSIFSNKDMIGFLAKNVSKRTNEVLNMLVTPKTDEEIAINLDLKINNVRRILNILQGYGLTKYYIAKNSNGWLSFAWYININKIDYFLDYIKQEKGTVLKEDCNDYFICNKCYKKNTVILNFDEAFNVNFKCSSCGKNYDRVEKTEVKKLIC